jgi:hypothetical protein
MIIGEGLNTQDIISRDFVESILYEGLFRTNDIDTIKILEEKFNNSKINNIEFIIEKINKNKLLFNLCEYNSRNVDIECYKRVINFLIKNKIYIEKQTCCDGKHNDYVIDDYDKFIIFCDYLIQCPDKQKKESIKYTIINCTFRETSDNNIRKYILDNYYKLTNNKLSIQKLVKIKYISMMHFGEINCPIYGRIGEFEYNEEIIQHIEVLQFLVKYMIKKYKRNLIIEQTYIDTVVNNYQDDDFNEIPYFTSLGYLLNEGHFNSGGVYYFYKTNINKCIL